MNAQYLSHAVEDVPSLKAVIIIAMPDCLLFDAWVRSDLEWSAEQVAAYFGDLFRANREGLKALSSWSSDMQVTIESPEHHIVLRELARDFVCACVFERSAALGMVRLHCQRLIERVSSALPNFEVTERPRGVLVIDFLHRYAPDAHAVLLRTSLRSGLSMDQLSAPERLTPDQVRTLEDTACQILGLKQLSL